MSSVLLYLTFIFGILTITEQKNKPVAEIQNLLNFLSQKYPNDRAIEVQKLPHVSGHPIQKRHKKRGDENNPNLMNIQTLNLYFKHNNNLRNKKLLEDDLEQVLRIENDKMCKITGRCGCSGGRCGKSRAEDKTINDIDQLLNYLNDDLNREENEDQRLHNENDNRDNWDDNNDIDRALKSNNNNLNDELNVILLEVPNSEEKFVTNNLKSLSDDIEIIDLRDLDIDKPKKSFNNDRSAKQTLDVNPEDLAKYYETGKRAITNSLLKYVKGTNSNMYLSQLLPYQRKQIKLLKTKNSEIPITDEDLKANIVQVLYGSNSSSKILPHTGNNNIYVPQHLYDAILKFKTKNSRRVKKNLFPLTSQQKERLQQKTITSDKIKKVKPPKIEHTWK